MNENNLRDLGSQTAKNGFANERFVVEKFNNWKDDKDAKKWLIIMKYELEDIDYVKAVIIQGEKTDVQVQVTIKLKEAIDVENLQVKLVSNPKGFNQIDKRWIDHYKELWEIPNYVVETLKYYTGELPPYIPDSKDKRRMNLNEIDEVRVKTLIEFLDRNRMMIVNDILKGRGRFSAEWFLVIIKTELTKWILKPINSVINHYGVGNIYISKRGTLHLARITVQRKGGDGGRDTAKMLQFKINPAELFNSENNRL